MGSPQLFTEVFDRHAPAIHRFVARRVGTHAADDVLSETFLLAFDQRGRFDGAYASARPWLYGIAANLMRRLQRSEIRRWRAIAAIGHTTEPAFDDDANERLDSAARLPMMAAVLASLNEGDRHVLLLFAWEDLSYAEIAVALDIPIGTVRSRLNRARTQMRAVLGPDVMQEMD